MRAFLKGVLRFLRLYPRPTSSGFEGSTSYWENRYAAGGNSGAGSFGGLAMFKARILNEFVANEHIDFVMEFGCGDGHQLSLAQYPRYLGVDVSSTAIAKCKILFAADPTKEFKIMSDHSTEEADATLSLDVIYHLVEDAIFDKYMAALFDCAKRWVVIYSSNFDGADEHFAEHVRHRHFTKWADANRPEWHCVRTIKNEFPFHGDFRTGSHADFHFYTRRKEV